MVKKINNSFSNDELTQFYEKMFLIRKFEEKAGQLYGAGKIGGFCHLYIGQEAVVIGILSSVKSEDTVVTSYRDHGHILARGVDPKLVMAELTGRKDGISKGKGGSMHMFSKKNRFYGGHGIVGAQVPIGVGLGFAHKYREEKKISRVYVGDGAMSNGQVFEAFNLASLWELPVLFIIENNKYGMGTAVNRSAAGNELFERATVFGIKGEKINGMNFFDVSEAAIRAREYIYENSKPYVIEMDTYRYRGHSMSDPATYRSKDEVNDMKSNDPLLNMKKALIDDYKIDEDKLSKIESDIKKQIKDVEKFSLESPLPELEELFTEVYL
ncbi:pyruvate dehydrogenase (acetyl-transferring) E1 component subunit alpha [Alphaproteobacteria bacterium]|jgi:pyruvate dehydrogenase E1 component alpha subunit|nr:pyruvate dehydrogenase (acetyl-transferring) E1 component subunit alpha [Alphaproteobacteria bacterium]|tara:strand:+ start:479 stop:1456 length:978 start_codon:yes stop_codon:yes gene_type:complete